MLCTAAVLLNELATQHEPALQREYLCLTSTGLYRFTKLRPIDQLRNVWPWGWCGVACMWCVACVPTLTLTPCMAFTRS